jgi:hypothetical protein
MRQRAAGEPGRLSRLGIAAGAFVSAVSFSLFIHSVSQLSSPIVSAAFIAGGIVARQRAATPTAHAIALGVLAGGVVAALASIALAAAGR